MTVLFWLVHIASVIMHARLWYLEWKYCRHRSYFWMPGMIFFLLVSMVPGASTLLAMAGSFDYTRNVIEELESK